MIQNEGIIASTLKPHIFPISILESKKGVLGNEQNFLCLKEGVKFQRENHVGTHTLSIRLKTLMTMEFCIVSSVGSSYKLFKNVLRHVDYKYLLYLLCNLVFNL